MPLTSVMESGAPDFILLELPDSASRPLQNMYNLEPEALHVLTIGETTIGKYRLAAVIMYQLNAHYCALARDPRDGWLRFDGMVRAGVAVPVPPPTGCQGAFYPVALLHVRSA